MTTTAPQKITVPWTVRISGQPHPPGLSLMRRLLADGREIVEVRPTDADEREWICDAPYRADLVCWHAGQAGCYGATPEAAVRALVGRDGEIHYDTWAPA